MPVPFIVHKAKANPNGFFGKLTYRVMDRKAQLMWGHLRPCLNGNRILDVGAGSGSISKMLISKRRLVSSIDVADLSLYEDVKIKIYNGKSIDAKNKEFDAAIIIHVLHHCSDKEAVLKEAMRVSKRVIFIEDTFSNPLEWLFLQFQDAITNFEFRLHDFATVEGWEEIIKRDGWKIKSVSTWSELLITSIYSNYVMYVIES